MLRRMVQLGVVLMVFAFAGRAAYGQTALGGATGTAALADSPALGVADHAGYFTSDAVFRTRTAIQQFREEYHRDLFIETFAHVPTADLKRVKAMYRKDHEAYFTTWAQTRAKAIGLDGVYVLICKEPKHVHVLVYPQTPEQAFSDRNASQLRSQLEHDLPRSPDAALSATPTFVRETVNKNLETRDSASSPFTVWTVVVIVAALLGFWLLLSLVRAVIHRAGANASTDPAHASLASGFLGATFGTTAGYWVHDRLFRAHAPAEPRPESDFLHTPPPPPPSDPDHLPETDDREASATW